MAKFCARCGKNVKAKADPADGLLHCQECGVTLGYSASALPPGTVIAGFRIEEPIGHGGMGVVYRATQLNLQRPAALKILSDELSDDPGFVESFFHEARVAANLMHPNIVQAYSAGTTRDGIDYFAMELIEGRPLNDLLEEKPLSFIPALQIALQIARALEYAWRKKSMCHGDIKPENILVTPSGKVKLADLGLARSVHEERVKRDVMVTPLYAAPELIAGKQTAANLRSDMYSFGAALYHILIGHPPFEGDTVEQIYRRHLKETPIPPVEWNPGIPRELSALVMHMLDKTPENRPQGWTEVIAALNRILGDAEQTNADDRRSPRGISALRLAFFTGAALLLVAAAILAYRYYRNQNRPLDIPELNLPVTPRGE